MQPHTRQLLLLLVAASSLVPMLSRSIPPTSTSRTLSAASGIQLDETSLHQLDCASINDTAACTTSQRSTLKAAIKQGVDHPETWLLWSSDKDNKLQKPQYGFWRVVEQVARPSAEQPAEEQHDNWIVITSVAPPTEQIKSWAALSNWKVVVVGDDKSPSDWQLAGVAFLSVDQQLQLPFKFAQQVPHKNYARKAVGYLYALQHGAKIIYESDDDNAPKPDLGLSWVSPEYHTQSLASTRGEGQAVNPYSYFGECTIWPRGFPLSDLLQHGANYCYPIDQLITEPSQQASSSPPLITRVPLQQGLADLDPDVDAIWRLARPADIGKIKFAKKPPLAYSRGTFAPYNTQNTVHHASAFWALFIPSGVNMRVCDIWRSYWAQRLLWEMDASVMFVSGTVDQVRNAHDYVTDFRDEMQMYVQVPAFIDFLNSWRCQHSHMYDCMLQLGYDMAVHDYWSPQDLALLTAWVHDLAALGYQPPDLVPWAAADAVAMQPLLAKQHPSSPFDTYMPWSSDELSGQRLRLYQRSHQQCAQLSAARPNIYLRQGGLAAANSSSGVYTQVAPGSGPYLSLLLASNNQDVTAQHTRLSHFLKNLAAYCLRYNLTEQVELLVVDYNSNAHLPPLWNTSSVKVPSAAEGLPLVRVITVTKAMHKLINHKIKAFADASFWEYLAKNIAIRRACGEYVLATNPDAWLSEGFWQLVAARALRPDMYYRMGRVDTDVKLAADTLELPIQQVADTLVQHAKGVCGPNPKQTPTDGAARDMWPDLRTWMAVPAASASAATDWGVQAVFGCPGDFLLMHRDAFSALRGYPEVPIPSQLDDFIIVGAVQLGLRCGIPPAPAVLFHMNHDRFYSEAARHSWHKIDLKVAMTFGGPAAGGAAAAGKPVKLYNDEGWGMAHHDLPEYYI